MGSCSCSLQCSIQKEKDTEINTTQQQPIQKYSQFSSYEQLEDVLIENQIQLNSELESCGESKIVSSQLSQKFNDWASEDCGRNVYETQQYKNEYINQIPEEVESQNTPAQSSSEEILTQKNQQQFDVKTQQRENNSENDIL